MQNRSKSKFLLLILILCVSQTAGATQSPRVALVLGGGAARGFSHIGLIQAFEDHGVPIDLLVGTSMGSIVAGMYAAGYSVDNMKEIIASIDTAKLIDVSFPPRGGLVNTARLERYLDTLLMHKTFDQLDIPFYAVITELVSGKEVAAHQGPVSQAVQASMSIPALFQPVERDGIYYVDGGMKNAVPVNTAKELGADVVIGVDVKKELETIDHDSLLNNLQLALWFMIDGYVEINTADADVIVVPEVKYDSYMDYQKAEFFIEQGYQAGLKHMDAIKAAVLSSDPDFKFTPYKQQGYAPEELAEIHARAEQAALATPRPFALLPEITFASEPGQKTKLGIRAQNGALGWFNLGFRRGLPFHGSRSEFFIGWNKPHTANAELFISPGEKLHFGFKAAFPVGDMGELSASYQNHGDYRWRVQFAHPAVIHSDHFQLGFAPNLMMPADQQSLSAGLTGLIKYYSSAEFYPLMEVTLAKPYFFGRFDVQTEVNSWMPENKYQVGLGTEFKLFGLYPLDCYLGLEIGNPEERSWRIGLRGEEF